MADIRTHNGTITFPAVENRNSQLWTVLGQIQITNTPVFDPVLEIGTEVFIDSTQGTARLDPSVAGTVFDVAFEYDYEFSYEYKTALQSMANQADIDLLTTHVPNMDLIISSTLTGQDAAIALATAFKAALISWKQVNI